MIYTDEEDVRDKYLAQFEKLKDLKEDHKHDLISKIKEKCKILNLNFFQFL